MLDNEPAGGERAGTQPAGDTAENAPTAPVRRTRRKATAPAAAEPGAATEAVSADEARTPSTGDAAAPPAQEPAPKVTRRRRKPAGTDGGDLAEPAGLPATGPLDDPPAAPLDQPAADAPLDQPAVPVKATRARRKKATPAADPTPPDVAAGETEPAPAPEAADVPPLAAVERLTVDRRTADGPVAAGGPAGVDQPAPDLPAADAPAGDAPRSRRRAAAPIPPAVLFMPPEPEAAPAARATSRRSSARRTDEVPVPEPDGVDDLDTGGALAEPTDTSRRRRRGRRAESIDAEAEVSDLPLDGDITVVVDEPDDTADDVEDDEDIDDGDDDAASARRRRRRGRRGRGRGKGPADEDEGDEPAAEAEAEAEAVGDDEEEEDEDGEAGVTRRRRRRRRKGAGDADPAVEDGVHTVVRIREPRPVRDRDEVQGVSGSTRLEAKRQRRRDGREQRRTRPPILSESEFLARREAVDRVMVVRQKPDRTQIAVLEDGVLVEHYVTRATSGTMVGNVYLGKVQNVLPSMEAAFVDVGRGRNAVLYAGEVNWDATGLEGRARSIEQALKSGDAVLVQVTKDPIGHKGARLTSHIALSGRHLVYVPNGNASGISRKLPDNERKRLRDILKKLVPDGAGVIVRTAAEGASEDELARDVKRLQAQWEDIQVKAADGGAPSALSEEPDLVIRVVRDLFNEDFRELVVQGDGSYDMVESYLEHVSPDLVTRLRRHTGVGDVFAEKRIDEQILKGLDRKVFLPSGGHLVIDRTEAMTVVDVNTGKYTGVGGNLEETVTRNNLEAAEEIVRQLRLRDLGGIVVIDFIDMVLESNRELVLRRLTECLGRDRTKHQVTEITSLGLVQMTRKRIGAGLLEAFSENCEHCKGRGLILHAEPVPERNRPGAGDRVRAVASAPTRTEPAAARGEAGTGRRRGRRGTEPVDEAPDAAVEAPDEPAPRGPAAIADLDDTMGYDLSRYESDAPDSDEDAEPMRLTGTDDPDAADADAEDGDEPVGAGAGGRRRSRRGGTRRRTRP